MRKLIVFILLLSFATCAFAKDTLVTRQGKKYAGKVIDRRGGNWILRTSDGTLVEIPESNTLKIIQGNIVYDMDLGQKYYLEIKRPYMPFAVLGIAGGAYSYKRFADYAKLHRDAEAQREQFPDEVVNTSDQKTAMAEGVVAALVCVGSFYIAFRPLKVQVPMGTFNLSLHAPNPGITVSLQF